MDFEERLIAPELTGEDSDVEVTLRPKTLEEYIGQDKAKENLSIFIEAAKKRDEALDHVLAIRPSRARQNDLVPNHRQRNECQYPHYIGTGN